MTAWIVNGDIFSEFSHACGTLPASELRGRLMNSQISEGDVFLPGQGLSEAEIVELESLAFHGGYAALFGMWSQSTPQRAPRSLTHKHRLENSLISIPEPYGNHAYRSHLLISPLNEMIIDHVTGQHVQGMVLIEACRQMFVAVSELCHMDDIDGRKAYVVFNTMEIAFKAFTYPIPALVEYKQISALSPRSDRTVISAELSVYQNKAATTTMIVNYTLFRPEQLRKKEVELGAAAVATHSVMLAASYESGLTK